MEDKNFFRYDTVEYAVLNLDGDYITPSIPNPKLILKKFNLWKETPKGYWIGYGLPNTLNNGGRWVSKTAKKRYAYPTKKEALINFIKRNERRVKILKRQVWSCEISLNDAKKELENYEKESI